MGITLNVNTAYLDKFIDGLVEQVAAARQLTAEQVQADWSHDVLARETGGDKPDGRPDYDQSIFMEEDGPDRTIVYTEIPWAPAQEYGGAGGTMPARPSAQIAAERARTTLPDLVAEALKS